VHTDIDIKIVRNTETESIRALALAPWGSSASESWPPEKEEWAVSQALARLTRKLLALGPTGSEAWREAWR
jgi:hypothetical protein